MIPDSDSAGLNTMSGHTATAGQPLWPSGKVLGWQAVRFRVRGRFIYLSLHCHHQNISCIKMGSDEIHFNVSLTVRNSHKRVSTDHNFHEEKGEPKQI